MASALSNRQNCTCARKTLQTQRGRTHGAGCVRQWFRTAEPLGERRYENWNTHTHFLNYIHFGIMSEFPCVECSQECLDDTLECSNCKNWVHRACVPLTASEFRAWSVNARTFLCKKCCFLDNNYDASAGLDR